MISGGLTKIEDFGTDIIASLSNPMMNAGAGPYLAAAIEVVVEKYYFG